MIDFEELRTALHAIRSMPSPWSVDHKVKHQIAPLLETCLDEIDHLRARVAQLEHERDWLKRNYSEQIKARVSDAAANCARIAQLEQELSALKPPASCEAGPGEAGTPVPHP